MRPPRGKWPTQGKLKRFRQKCVKFLALAGLGFFCRNLPHLRPLQAMTRLHHLHKSMDSVYGLAVYITGAVVVPRGVPGWKRRTFLAKKLG